MLAPSGGDSARVPPLDLSGLVYCGVRDFEPGQREKIERHGIRTIFGATGPAPGFAGALQARLAGLPRRVLVHLDLDCLDPSVGQANEYAAPGGLSTDDLVACMVRIARQTEPVGLTIASFNPDLPDSDAIAATGIRAAQAVVEAIVRACGAGRHVAPGVLACPGSRSRPPGSIAQDTSGVIS